MELPRDYRYYNVILWSRDGRIRCYAMYAFSLDFLNENFDYVLFLKFDVPLGVYNLKINELIEALERIYASDPDAFIMLTPRKKTPLYNESADEFIYSFSCNLFLFRALIRKYGKTEFQEISLLFEVLDQILGDNSGFKKILVRQLPIQHVPVTGPNECDVIIPHRGDVAYLKNLLSFLNQIKGIRVHVGIDQEITEELLKIKNNYPQTSFYGFAPNPVGPYVVRNWLIDNSSNGLVFFQDSDDTPCADRFGRLSTHMINNPCQLCGSHEIRLDYYHRNVRAIRYPVNVRSALDKSPGHSLLHPSSVITRQAFYQAGKLSEERIFGNDTKFLFHSYFILTDIQNIDDFLYIRRKRPGSLTTAVDTEIGSPVRVNLLNTWLREFGRIKYSMLKLENSSLEYEGTKLKFSVRKLE